MSQDKPKYSAKVKILGKTYTANGKTVYDAIANLKPAGRAAGVGILSIAKGKQNKEVVLNKGQVARLFALSPLMREVAIKQTAMRLNI